MEFECERATDTDFDYMESGEGEVQTLGLDIEQREEPLSVTLCCGRYAVVTLPSKVKIVDLARARERLLYNYYATSLQSGHCVSQQLLFPEQLTLTDEEYDLFEEYAVDFAALGFDIKAQGSNTIEVFGIPADVHTEQLDKAVYDLLQSLKLPQSVVEERREMLAQTLAHSESVGSIRFTQEDAERLVVQILATSDHYTKSGRRIMKTWSAPDIKELLD
jgi:DNA mismatch repair protein MutL